MKFLQHVAFRQEENHILGDHHGCGHTGQTQDPVSQGPHPGIRKAHVEGIVHHDGPNNAPSHETANSSYFEPAAVACWPPWQHQITKKWSCLIWRSLFYSWVSAAFMGVSTKKRRMRVAFGEKHRAQHQPLQSDNLWIAGESSREHSSFLLPHQQRKEDR